MSGKRSDELDEARLATLGLDSPPTRVVVVGGGVAGLVAARDCARVGFEVTLLESADRVGGLVASHDVAGLQLDSGAESFATRGGHVAELIEELGLRDRLVAPDPEGAWVRLGADSMPLPRAGLLGIPSSPLATDVIRAIGWSGALRAYLDRVMPVLKIGQERNLGALVRKRMGRKVLERLVAPVATGVYSAEPDQLDVAVVAPGLNQAITRAGSLSGAVAELRSASRAGSAVGGLAGGMRTLVDALEADVRARGAQIRTGVRVVALEPADTVEIVDPEPDQTSAEVPEQAQRGPDGESNVPVAPGEASEEAPEHAQDEPARVPDAPSGTVDDARAVQDGAPAAGPGAPGTAALGEASGSPGTADAGPSGAGESHRGARWRLRLGDGESLEDGETVDADAVIIAAPGPAALALLRGVGEATAALAELDWPAASSVELGTLVVDVPELGAHPRGTGMLVSEDAEGVTAKALTHATAKWAWLAEAAGPDRHVIRLSYGRAGTTSATSGLDDAAFRELVRRDASELLGIPIAESRIAGFARTRWTNALPFAAVGQRERIRSVREAVAGVDGLEVTGAWLTGTGLASVVPAAREAARAVRGLRWRELSEDH